MNALQFSAPLVIAFDADASKQLGGDYWRVQKDFKFYLPDQLQPNEWVAYDPERWISVQAGMLTDLGTIPRLLRSVVDEQGLASQAYVTHDQACEYLSVTYKGQPQAITRRDADCILVEAMRALGCGAVQISMVYSAVRAYAELNQINTPSTFALKRQLESQWRGE